MAGAAYADTYLTIEGYGKTEQQAAKDAKQQLALSLYSNIEVEEETRQVSKGGKVISEYEMRSVIRSLPIDVPHLEMVSENCETSTCRYQFRVNKTRWITSLKQDVAEHHDIISDYLPLSGKQWRDVKRLGNIRSDLISSEQALIILSSLEADEIALPQDKQSRLIRHVARYENGVQISYRASNDRFAAQMKAALTEASLASAHGDITVYLKGVEQKGKRGKQFVAKQTLIIQIFEASNPGVVVAQNQLSTMGTSSTSSDSALEMARQQIIKKVQTQSIYSLLD